MAEVHQLPVALREVDDGAALELAVSLGHPVYDCTYLALAHSLDLRLVTADRRLREAVRVSPLADQLLGNIVLLADYA